MNCSHAHRILPMPSNVRRGPVPEPREWDRRDPGYWDDPQPLDWHELADPWLWLAAVAVVVAFVAFCGLCITVLPGPGA